MPATLKRKSRRQTLSVESLAVESFAPQERVEPVWADAITQTNCPFTGQDSTCPCCSENFTCPCSFPCAV